MGTDIVTNRKARHSYTILETLEAGLALKGTEVKSIRAGLANMTSAFARLEKGELFLHGLDIQPYIRASHEQHEAKRPRRLLVHRAELLKLREAVEIKAVPFPRSNFIGRTAGSKSNLAWPKGKSPDKRQDLKRQVAEREAARTAAAFNRRG